MGQKTRAAPLRLVFSIVLVDLVAFGIVIPQLGIYGVKFRATPLEIGLLLSVYSLMQFISAPVLGRISDRHGRRPVLLYSVLGSFVAALLFALAGSFELLFLARVVDGLSGGNIATAQAYVADVTAPEDRARGMGMVGAAIGLGFVLGPAIGGVLGAWGGNFAIGLGAAAFAGTNLVLAYFLLPESLNASSSRAVTRGLATVWPQLRVPVVGLVLLVYLLFTVAFAEMEGTFSVFIIERFIEPGVTVGLRNVLSLSRELDPELLRRASLKVGALFGAVGLVMVVVQGGLVGRLKRAFGEPALAVSGALLAALGLFLLPAAPSYGWVFVPMALLAAGSGLATPSLSALVSLHCPADRRGETLGAFQSMGSMGRIIGPALGGLLFTLAGTRVPYLVAAALMGVSAGLAVRLASRVAREARPAA
jgi:multidrug resistance protein